MKHAAFLLVAALTLSIFGVTAVAAGDVAVAVGANFAGAMNRLAPEFERQTGHKVIASFGSTGKFYAQIRNGAPFDVLLAADDEHPRKLEADGLTVAGTGFTYAVGRLALWSAKPGVVDANGDILRKGEFAHIAVANAKTAPYGVAAERVMRRLGVWERLSQRRAIGENITQTFQFVNTGNALLGFVALAQVRALPPAQAGSHWLVPAELHDPLRQDAVLLRRGIGNKAAIAFLEFLRSPTARSVIEELGYTVPR